ncbi:unnamed protein product, partial [Effrenium voratum]
ARSACGCCRMTTKWTATNSNPTFRGRTLAARIPRICSGLWMKLICWLLWRRMG